MRITNSMINAAIDAYATKRHPSRWDGPPWGLAGQKNHRAAIKEAIKAALRQKTQESKS